MQGSHSRLVDHPLSALHMTFRLLHPRPLHRILGGLRIHHAKPRAAVQPQAWHRGMHSDARRHLPCGAVEFKLPVWIRWSHVRRLQHGRRCNGAYALPGQSRRLHAVRKLAQTRFHNHDCVYLGRNGGCGMLHVLRQIRQDQGETCCFHNCSAFDSEPAGQFQRVESGAMICINIV